MQYFQSHKLKEGDCDFNQIEVKQLLGKGNSMVFDVKFKKQPAAMKQIVIKNQEQAQQVINQISMMKKLSSKDYSIIKYLGSFTTIRQLGLYNMNQMTYIVMEKAIMSLEQFIQGKIRSHDIFNEIEIISIMKVLISTLARLQKSGIAHCDIKPENILIMKIQTLEIKLCDVGSCRITNQSTQEATLVGTVPFLAPELVRGFNKDRITNNPFKSDVFSLGLCFLYILSFKKFKSTQRLKVNQSMYKQILIEWISQAKIMYSRNEIICSLLDLMLQFDQNIRVSFVQLNDKYKKLILQEGMKKNQIIKQSKKKQEQTFVQKCKKSMVNYISTPQQTKKSEDFSQTNTNGFAFRITLFNADTPSILRKRKFIVPKKIDVLQSTQTKFSTFSPLLSKRPTNSMKLSSLTLQDSPQLKFPKEKNESTSQFLEHKIILIDLDNLNSANNSFVNWQQKLVIIDGCSFNHHDINYLTVKLKSEFDLEMIMSTNKQDQSLNSLMVDMRGIQSDSKFMLYNTNTYKIVKNMSLFLQNSSLSHYSNLMSIWLTKSLSKLFVSLKRSSISPSTVCQILSWIAQQLNLQSVSFNFEYLKINQKQNKFILQKISKLKNLRVLKLNLCNNNISYTKQHPWQFPKNIQKLTLQYAHNDLRSVLNNISIALSSVKESLRQLVLNLEDTALSSKEVNFLFNCLTKLQLDNLYLKLGYNQLDDSVTKYISKNLILLQKISYLYIGLQNTNISFDGYLMLLSGMEKICTRHTRSMGISFNRWIDQQSLFKVIENTIKIQMNKINICFQDLVFSVWLKSRQLNSKKRVSISVPKKTFCQRLHCSGQPSKYYSCLTCIQKNNVFKKIFFCQHCIQSCNHFQHSIIPVYNNVSCGCTYLQCKLDINKLPCSNREGILVQKGFKCISCQKDNLCITCAQICRNSHPLMLVQKSHVSKFRCCDIKSTN